MAGLKEWFKQDWVDIGAKRKGFKKCGRKSASGSKRKNTPNACLLQKQARMTESQRAGAVARKQVKLKVLVVNQLMFQHLLREKNEYGRFSLRKKIKCQPEIKKILVLLSLVQV